MVFENNVNNQTELVTGNIQTQQIHSSSNTNNVDVGFKKPKVSWKVFLIIFGLILIIVVIYLLIFSNKKPTEINFSDRKVVVLTNTNQEFAYNGECIESYQIYTAGVVSGVQQYTLSIILKSNPINNDELISKLNEEKCQSENDKVSSEVVSKLNLTNQNQDVFTTTYTTKNGNRIILP
ncbi:MAG: hypothetical protein ACD_58C00287G0013 [uncultured bacterium]|nr:MAG: hypothetical protein ACD_58C00287G0013 [uncultured bacterium]